MTNPVTLPAPCAIRTEYEWKSGPIVNAYNGQQARLVEAIVTEWADDPEVRCNAYGYVVKTDGTRDRRYPSTAIITVLDADIIAAHLAARGRAFPELTA